MSRTRSGKKKGRGTGAARPAAPRVAQPPVISAEILPAGGVVRKAPAPKVEEPAEKAFYGETAGEMLGRVRRELRNIGILAVISFGVGFLVVLVIKM